MNDLFDTPAYKLVRASDPSTSHEAADQLDATAMERIVLSAIKTFGNDGCISDDVLNILPHHGYSTITARYKQLKEKGFVIVDERKRKGKSGRNQLVMWAKEFYTPQEKEYVDDWSCKKCSKSGISQEYDNCPECNEEWG